MGRVASDFLDGGFSQDGGAMPYVAVSPHVAGAGPFLFSAGGIVDAKLHPSAR